MTYILLYIALQLVSMEITWYWDSSFQFNILQIIWVPCQEKNNRVIFPNTLPGEAITS